MDGCEALLAGRSQKSKVMLTNFSKWKSVYDDWTVDETRLADPSNGRWEAAAEIQHRVSFAPRVGLTSHANASDASDAPDAFHVIIHIALIHIPFVTLLC